MPFYFNKFGLNIYSLVDFYPGSEFLWLKILENRVLESPMWFKLLCSSPDWLCST